MTTKDIQNFNERGYLILSGMVPAGLATAAVAAAPPPNWGSDREPPKLALLDLPEVMSKMLALVQPVADRLCGKPAEFREAIWSVHETGRGFGGGQRWHVDGFGTVRHGGTWDELPSFRLLVGVFLTNLLTPRRGNLMLTSGGHRQFADWIDRNAPAHFGADGRCLDSAKLLEAMKTCALPELSPMLVGAGDVVVAHSLSPHGVDFNDGPCRPAVYFRLGTPDLRGLPGLRSPWVAK